MLTAPYGAESSATKMVVDFIASVGGKKDILKVFDRFSQIELSVKQKIH